MAMRGTAKSRNSRVPEPASDAKNALDEVHLSSSSGLLGYEARRRTLEWLRRLSGYHTALWTRVMMSMLQTVVNSVHASPWHDAQFSAGGWPRRTLGGHKTWWE